MPPLAILPMIVSLFKVRLPEAMKKPPPRAWPPLVPLPPGPPAPGLPADPLVPLTPAATFDFTATFDIVTSPPLMTRPPPTTVWGRFSPASSVARPPSMLKFWNKTNRVCVVARIHNVEHATGLVRRDDRSRSHLGR